MNIEEIRKPELDARLVADSSPSSWRSVISSSRHATRDADALRLGAQGIKVRVAGRLRRRRWHVPRGPRRAGAVAHAARRHRLGDVGSGTTYGVLGVKVWIFKGEVMGAQDEARRRPAPKTQRLKKDAGADAKQETGMLQPAERSSAGAQRPQQGLALRRQQSQLRRVPTESHRPRPSHRPPNRVGAAGDDASCQSGGGAGRVFPDKPYAEAAGVRHGNGKGNAEFWVAVAQPGKVLYEMDGVDEDIAREAFALAAAKLPVRTTLRRLGWWAVRMISSRSAEARTSPPSRRRSSAPAQGAVRPADAAATQQLTTPKS